MTTKNSISDEWQKIEASMTACGMGPRDAFFAGASWVYTGQHRAVRAAENNPNLKTAQDVIQFLRQETGHLSLELLSWTEDMHVRIRERLGAPPAGQTE